MPATGAHCGAPSREGVNCGPLTRLTVAVCGIEFSITASCACGVPATVGSTAAARVPGGMRAKSAGSALAATKVQGPPRPGAVNQRPAIST